MKDVTVIIVNWNRRDLLADCLRSLQANTGEISYDLYVVDNASSDGSSQMVQMAFPTVHLVQNQENLGFARANNQAIRQSHSRYVLLLNSDTRASATTLNHMVRFMDTHPQVGIAGCKLLNPDGTWQPSINQFPTPFNLVFGKLQMLRWQNSATREPSQNLPQEVDAVTGACMIVRRQAIEEVGLLDENIFLYVEDTEWCYRMKRHSWQVLYVPSVQITHILGGSRQALTTGVWRQKHEYCRNQIHFYQKHYPKRRLYLYRLLRGCWILPLCGILAVQQMVGRGDRSDDLLWVGKILRELIWTTKGMRTFGRCQHWTSS